MKTNDMQSPQDDFTLAQRFTLDRLQGLLDEWERTGQMPEEVGGLSSGESAALAIAARREELLESPVEKFLLLDGWLQRWVMRRRDLGLLIDTPVGHLYPCS